MLASNPLSNADRVAILLLQQIDVAWWSHVAPYATRDAIDGAPELLRLPDLQKAGALRFSSPCSPSAGGVEGATTS